MNKIELVQKIGDEVCEMCGPDSDCDIAPSECSRIKEAVNLLDEYASQQAVEADAESPHLFKYCGVVEHPKGANYCYKCGGALRTA